MKQAITPGRFGASGHSAQPSAGIPQPANGALHDPAAAIAPQGAAILRRRTNAILFVPVQNCRTETTRSTATAGTRSTRSGTRPRCSTTRPARPSPAVAASKSKGADISLASPASERRCAESTESLRGRDGCRSTGGHLALLGWPGEQGRDLLPLRFGQQRTGPRHPPSFGAADSAYRISQNSTIVISDACTRLCNSF